MTFIALKLLVKKSLSLNQKPFYLNISIPGIFGIPSFATAANSASLI